MVNRKRIFLASITMLVMMGMLGSLGRLIPAAAQVSGPRAQVDTQVLEALQSGETADYVIVMAEQADLSAAYGISDWEERGWYVYNTLKETAARTQKSTLAQLKRQGIRYQSFFAGNEIYVHGGTQQSLNAVIDLAEVGSVRAPLTVQLEPAGARFSRPLGPAQPQAALQTELNGSPTWGLDDTGAPAFWSDYGRTGQGIIVANIDSGVQYDHPALANSYRCINGNLLDPKCWYDATGDTPEIGPHDDLGHGTHTMGTMVGTTVNYYSTTYTIGMAPGATWIACRAFIGRTGYNADILECADWILAPGGDPSNRPHVVNNSWGGDVHDTFYQLSVQAWKAAGMFPVFSAGNDGSVYTCSDIGSPADYPESLTVASHDSAGTIALDSSKGPVLYGGDLNIKPNISSPGVDVLSTVPINGWAMLSGTSMAAPHAAGAVALLWSCNPALRGQIDTTFDLLENSAADSPDGACGVFAPDGNYTYGHGYLDVYQAGAGTCIDWHETYLPIISHNTNVPPDPIQNGGFEAGQISWNEYSENGWVLILDTSVDLPLSPHNGAWLTWLGGDDEEISFISQTVTIPAGRSILHYWFASGSQESDCGSDVFRIYAGSTILFSEGQCDLNETNAWIHRTLDLTAYTGTTQTIKFYISTDSLFNSNVFVDDISLEASTTLSGINENPAAPDRPDWAITRDSLTP
ncbi:MAG: S8 family serine peptidase [Bellilinea sp.]